MVAWISRNRGLFCAFPQPFVDAATGLYWVKQIPRCCLKDGDGFDEVRFS